MKSGMQSEIKLEKGNGLLFSFINSVIKSDTQKMNYVDRDNYFLIMMIFL